MRATKAQLSPIFGLHSDPEAKLQKLLNDICGDAVVGVYGTPRMVAGDALTNDTNKCRLKPLSRAELRSMILPIAGSSTLAIAFPAGPKGGNSSVSAVIRGALTA